MKRLELTLTAATTLAVALTGCAKETGSTGSTGSGGTTNWTTGSGSGDSGDESSSEGGSSASESGGDSGGDRLDLPSGDSGGTGCSVDIGCTDQIDLLFVIDNSGSMAEEQQNLARNFPLLIQQLQDLSVNGVRLDPDVNVMVTTTDFGNPACDAYREGGPEKGAPVFTPCTERMPRFDRLKGYTMDDPPQPIRDDKYAVCSGSCTTGARPTNHFIHFSPAGHNVQGGEPADGLQCIGPVGIDGCGYEAQLESMLQALNTTACWNDPTKCDPTKMQEMTGVPFDPALFATPFLRPNALLGIVMVTDEVDCSVKDYTIMTNGTFFEVNPDTTAPEPSSAICWNAGVVCDGPDAGTGLYSNCRSTDNGALQPTARYKDYLINELRGRLKKEVVMLGILGVPLVTEHNPNPPYQPTAGGVYDLEFRDWVDPEYPTGDILPEDWAAGRHASYKQWEFGIGPGCTGEDGMGGFTGQALPPVSIREVCEALNVADDPATPNKDETEIRCCIESICDTDFSAAIKCLTGIIETAIIPPG